MLKLLDVEYAIGERTLFSSVNFTLNAHDRYGLVGANGTGKTTLLRIITGDVVPTRGLLQKHRAVRIGYLPQEEIVLHGSTLVGEVLRDYDLQLHNLEHMRKLISENPRSQELLHDYQKAEDAFMKCGGYDYESLAYRVINGLGFTPQDYKKPVEEFSSGWQMRIVLARLLLNKPNLLLLDEPTNHLDIESIQWLENFLRNFKGAMIIVSHDRYFLDKILRVTGGVRGILEIDFGSFRRYRTDYSGYLRESQIRKERLLHASSVQEKKIEEIKDFIARNKANKSKAGLVKSREKYLERMERIQIETERKTIKVRFPVETVHSRRIIELKNINKVYDRTSVLTNTNLLIERGDRIALIGKNGAGKSTLCRIIAGFEQPTDGERWTSERLKIGAFSHEIVLKLNTQNTVLEEVAKDAVPEVSAGIRAFLGLFLFSGDDVHKKIDVLSGGEKTRLVILKAMTEPSNMLILDEPTYHLDKDSVDAIQQALASYEGTTILVTHDRDLIQSFATRIIELKDGRLVDYPGDFNYYLWKKQGGMPQPERAHEGVPHEKPPADTIRRTIAHKEARRNQLRAQFSRTGTMSNPRKSRKLFEEYQRLTQEIEELEHRLSSEKA